MALFIALIVLVVVIQACLDWRDTRRVSPLPTWVSGVALASILGAFLTGATSLASYLYLRSFEQRGNGFDSTLFWPQLGFLLCAMSIVILAVRKRRMPLLVILAGLLTAAFWLGFAMSS